MVGRDARADEDTTTHQTQSTYEARVEPLDAVAIDVAAWWI
jgi:hypothetical protein